MIIIEDVCATASVKGDTVVDEVLNEDKENKLVDCNECNIRMKDSFVKLSNNKLDEDLVQDVIEEKENTLVEFNGDNLKIKDSFVKLLKKRIDTNKSSKKNTEVVTERHIEFEDSADLPEGWTRFRKYRATASSGRGWDRYVQSPDGSKFDRPSKIDKYLKDLNLDIVINFNPTKPCNSTQNKKIEVGNFKNQLIEKFALIKSKTSDIIKMDQITQVANPDARKLPESEALNVDNDDVLEVESVIGVKDEVCCRDTTEDVNSKKDEEKTDIYESKTAGTAEDNFELKRKVPHEFNSSPRKKPNIVTSLTELDKLESGKSDSSNQDATRGSEEPEEHDDKSSESELNTTLKSNCDTEGVNISEVSDELVEENETSASDLPEGWSRIEIPKAFSIKDLIVVVKCPDGRQFDSQKKLNSYLARNKMPFKIDIDGPFQKFEAKVEADDANDNGETEENVENTDDLDSYHPNKKNEKTKKEKTVETDKSLTNQDIDDEEDTNFTTDELKYIEDIDKFLKETNLKLKASPATKGDGNCWFRAVADQVVIHDIPDKARNHRSLRLEVCDHTKKLPEDIVDNLVNVLWSGRKKNLRDLACRQRKAGQWVDNTGIMVLTTAYYLARNIHLYSYPHESSSSLYSLTKIDAGPEADNHPPLTVFFYDKHYQTLQKDDDAGPESENSIDNDKPAVSDEDENIDKSEENENFLDSTSIEEGESSEDISKTEEITQDTNVQDLKLSC